MGFERQPASVVGLESFLRSCLVTLTVVAILLVAPAARAQDAPDSDVEVELEWWPGATDLQQSDLQDLDVLLQDPVRLVEADLHRLLWIPWVSLQQVESLRRALPVRNRADWAQLPTWSPEEVERILPFVHLVEARRRRPEAPATVWESNLLVRDSGSRGRVFLQHDALRLSLQESRGTRRAVNGHVTWQGRSVSLILGDQRRSEALGLLLSSRVVSGSARSSIGVLERWTGSTSTFGDRVLRGAGVQVQSGRQRWMLQRGALGDVTLYTAGLGIRLAQHTSIQLSALQADSRSWCSVFVQHGDRALHGALEVVQQKEGWAAALVLHREVARWTLEAQAMAVPHGLSSPLGAVPAAARTGAWSHLRARCSWSSSPLRLRVSWAQTLENGAASQQQNDVDLLAVSRLDRVTLETQWRSKQTQARDVDIEFLEPLRRQRDETFLLRARCSIVSHRTLWIERRSRRTEAEDGATARGHAWRMALRQEWRSSDVDVSVAFLEAMPGATIVVSEPAVGQAPALVHASSSGMRAAARLRQRWRGMQAAVRVAAGWRAGSAWNPVIELALRLHSRRRNGF